MKNNCDNISSNADLYTPLLSSKGHVYQYAEIKPSKGMHATCRE